MDTDFLQDVKEHAHNFENINHISKAQQCPKCQNFLIEEGICLSCGYNLNFNLLGEPLGEKSFYTIRENYWEGLSLLERENYKLFKDEVKFKHYLNKTKMRYNDLLDFFYSEASLEDQHRALYLHELRDLILELMENDVDEEEIWKPLNEKQETVQSATLSLFDQIKTVVNESKAIKKANRKNSRLNLFGGGRISISSIIVGILFLTLAVGLSLAYFSYQKFN